MTELVIQDLLIILAAGLVASLVCRQLRISVLMGYLIAGALLGGGVSGWVLDQGHQLESFAEAGVFLLLFSIGLEFSLDDLRRLGRNLFIGGAVQMLLVAVPVGGLLIWQDVAWQPSVLIAAALAFSSTVLVFKALSEWGQSQKPHGQRAIGILLFQDAALVPLLLLVPLLTGTDETIGVRDYLRLAVVSVVFLFAVIAARHLLGVWLIPRLARYRSPELIILFTIVSLGGVTSAAHAVGLPPAVGAFAAGLIFNGNRWTRQIDALVLPFRETFAAVFFVGLGLILDPRLLWQDPLGMGGTLVCLIVLKAAAATVALKLTGLSFRHAMGMGLGLAHVGEFAFVLMLLGVETSVIREEDYARVVALAVGSLVLTPALMKLGLRLIRESVADESDDKDWMDLSVQSNRACVIGAGPIGRQVASQWEISGKDVCVVDLSPINLHGFAQEGFRTVAGDAADPETLRLADVPTCLVVAVCVPDDLVSIQVVRASRKLNPRGNIIVRCRYQMSIPKLKKAGADRVVSEEAEASVALTRILSER